MRQNLFALQESSGAVEDGLTGIQGGYNKENCSNKVLSGRWKWQQQRQFWNQGKDGYNEVDEYDLD